MFSTYQRLRLPVWASDREVIRAARKRIAVGHRTNPAKKDARWEFYRRILECHHDAQALRGA